MYMYKTPYTYMYWYSLYQKYYIVLINSAVYTCIYICKLVLCAVLYMGLISETCVLRTVCAYRAQCGIGRQLSIPLWASWVAYSQFHPCQRLFRHFFSLIPYVANQLFLSRLHTSYTNIKQKLDKPSILDDLIDGSHQRALNNGHPQPQHSSLGPCTSHQLHVVLLIMRWRWLCEGGWEGGRRGVSEGVTEWVREGVREGWEGGEEHYDWQIHVYILHEHERIQLHIVLYALSPP